MNYGPKLYDIPVVKAFPNMFFDELPGMPPEREVEFFIDLLPDTTPIYKTPYRMGHIELQELVANNKNYKIKVSFD